MNTKANIIIIEDEKNICNFIETVLSPQGYQVTSAHTGTDGLKLIESLKPDVVLLDLGLPDMDGLELIQEVRSTSALPIIVISARTLERCKVAFSMIQLPRFRETTNFRIGKQTIISVGSKSIRTERNCRKSGFIKQIHSKESPITVAYSYRCRDIS